MKGCKRCGGMIFQLLENTVGENTIGMVCIECRNLIEVVDLGQEIEIQEEQLCKREWLQ